MNQARALVDRLRAKGVVVRVEEENLKIAGKPNPDEIEAIRSNKADILKYLREQGNSPFRSWRKVEEGSWPILQRLASHLGESVTLDSREVKLWGITPHGAIVDVGSVLITVEPDSLNEV